MLRKVEKNKNLVFKNQYKALSDQDKEVIRVRWVECSGKSVPSFYQKLRDETFMPLEVNFLLNEVNSIANSVS